MAQIVIDGVLFSPTLAHSLEPGDLYCYVIAGGPRQGEFSDAKRVTAPPHGEPWGMQIPTEHEWPDAAYSIPFGRNDVVYRAVGARAGRGGAR